MPPEEGAGGAADAGQGDQGQTGQGQGSADAGQQQGSADAGQQQGRSDDAAAVIARLNAEAKDWRQKYETAQASIDEQEQAKMSETERLQAKLSEEEGKRIEAERKVQELSLSQSVRDAAVKAGAVDPDLVWRALDLNAVEFDASGTPKGLDKLIEALKAKHPVLFQAVQGDGDQGARGSGAPTSDMNELIRRGARKSA